MCSGSAAVFRRRENPAAVMRDYVVEAELAKNGAAIALRPEEDTLVLVHLSEAHVSAAW